MDEARDDAGTSGTAEGVRPGTERPLSAAQQKVALLARHDPLGFATSSVQVIAQRAQVSEATVVRTARRLGYAGLPELKAACLASHRTAAALPEVIKGRFDALGEDVEASILRSHSEVEQGFSETFTAPGYAALLQGCLSASRLVFFGLGTAYSVATYAALECRRNGVEAVALTGGGHSLADAVFALRPGDCVLTLAPINVGPDLRRFARAAARGAHRSVMISQLDEPDGAAPGIDWVRLPGTSDTPTSETFVLWTLIDVLIARLSVEDRDRAIGARERLQAIRDDLASGDGDDFPAADGEVSAFRTDPDGS
ncbi:MurR/RpiR family transcriptional regulator [Brachybacterium sp. GCM10030267]|uniref:MurR/RpiR family transcriptional regulator n=1 Tax=unclassified Brachybacterium TaxID=2623841 RepID=UPI0036081F12